MLKEKKGANSEIFPTKSAMSTNKKTYFLAFLLSALAVFIYWIGERQEATRIDGFERLEDDELFWSQILPVWRSLPGINGTEYKNLLDGEVIAVFVFSINDCGPCLARMNEMVAIIDSIGKNDHQIGLTCVAVNSSIDLLRRYLLVSPKPCPILVDTTLGVASTSFDYTPQLFIIDRRDQKAIISRAKINARKISPEFRYHLSMALRNGKI